MTDSDAAARLGRRARKARAFMQEHELRGWDPYDALLSPLFDLPILRSRKLPRFGAQQLVLRTPVNLRPLLRVPQQLNPVTVGLYVQGIADLAEASEIDSCKAADEASDWIERLRELSSPGVVTPSWGYPFGWEGRRHSMPSRLPTIVATGMVVNGLHRAWQVFGQEAARELIVASAGFVLDELPRAAGDERAWCWSYSPVDRQAVLNATMKGTRLLAQALDAGLDDARAKPAAVASARFVAERQEDDGGWPYAVEDPRTWRDHHHTGYVLECFDTYRRLSGDNSFDDVIDKGWRHYRQAFFDDAALPLYYDDRGGPLDPTVAGQALITLAAYGDTEFGLAVAEATVGALGRADGSFAYRPGSRGSRYPNFMRWSTAWMFAGLARLRAEVEHG